MIDTFDVTLQEKVLTLMFRDRDFMSKNHYYLKSYYFESALLMDLSRLSLDFFKKYNTLMDLSVILLEVQIFLDSHSRPNPEEYIQTIKQIFSDNLLQKEYIKDKVLEFVKAQEYKKAFTEGLDFLQAGAYDKINEVMVKAGKVGNKFNTGMFYFEPEEIEERWKNDFQLKIPTGITELDGILGGGIEYGELGMFLAAPGVGKSLLLNIIGSGALKLRKKVAHYSHEMRKKKVGRRYDRCLMEKSFLAINDNQDKHKQFLIQFAKNLKTNLYIQDYPTKTATVQDMRKETEYLAGVGFHPELVLVDYAAIVKPSSNREKHEQIEDICEELRGMGGEMFHATWTVAQTKSEGVKKAVLNLDDFGKSFAQTQVADVIVAICQTQEEYEANEIRLFVVKNRDGAKFQMLSYKINYETLGLVYTPS